MAANRALYMAQEDAGEPGRGNIAKVADAVLGEATHLWRRGKGQSSQATCHEIDWSGVGFVLRSLLLPHGMGRVRLDRKTAEEFIIIYLKPVN